MWHSTAVPTTWTDVTLNCCPHHMDWCDTRLLSPPCGLMWHSTAVSTTWIGVTLDCCSPKRFDVIFEWWPHHRGIQFWNWSGNWKWKIWNNINLFWIERYRIGIEIFWVELNDFELNWNWIKRNWVSDILQTVGSIAVQTMVFNDQEKLDNEAAGQTLPSS